MKKVISLILLTVSLLFLNCTEDNNVVKLNDPLNEVISYKSTKLSNIDSKTNQEIYLIENIITKDNDFNNNYLKDIVAKINITENIVVFTNKVEKGSVTYKLVREKSIYRMELLKIGYNNNLAMRTDPPKWVCKIQCIATGFAWSLLDGPAPFMDAAAMLYVYTCVRECMGTL